MVIAGDIQDSPKRYFRARQEIEIQKLPVVAKVIIETGSAIKLPI
jgi:transcription termination factor Rho